MLDMIVACVYACFWESVGCSTLDWPIPSETPRVVSYGGFHAYSLYTPCCSLRLNWVNWALFCKRKTVGAGACLFLDVISNVADTWYFRVWSSTVRYGTVRYGSEAVILWLHSTYHTQKRNETLISWRSADGPAASGRCDARQKLQVYDDDVIARYIWNDTTHRTPTVAILS